MNEVVNFINVFTSSSENKEIIKVFDGKCSYWFAMILFRRFIFKNSKIMYDKNKHHFGTMVNNRVYDVTGDVTTRYLWESWIAMTGNEKDDAMNKYIMF